MYDGFSLVKEDVANAKANARQQVFLGVSLIPQDGRRPTWLRF